MDIPTPSTETPPSAEAAHLPPTPTPATPKAAAAVHPSSAPSSAVEKAPVARKFSDEGTAQRRNRVNVSDVS